MSNQRKVLTVTVLLLLTPLFASKVSACTCSGSSTTLGEFESAAAVVIAKAQTVVHTPDGSGVNGIKSTILTITKAYKGPLKPGAEIIINQGSGSDCMPTFDVPSMGREYLFFFDDQEREGQIWRPIACGSSSSVENATEHLLYLNNIRKLRGKTRVSGELEFDTPEIPVGAIRITLSGDGGRYTTKTDSHGVFEIYDVPPGKYYLESDLPDGWKINDYYLKDNLNVDLSDSSNPLRRFAITVVKQRHTSVELHFKIDNAIRGQVFDLAGKPMKDVCITALDSDSKAANGASAYTEADGTFELTELYGQRYVLAINYRDRISSSEPFSTFYYPNVRERIKATVLSVAPGQIIEGLTIVPAEMAETITIEGVVQFSDGSPVPEAYAEFEPTAESPGINGTAQATTDANGRFSLKILKGQEGAYFGNMLTYSGEFENCPELESAITSSANPSEVRTPSQPFVADRNIVNLVIRFPFPKCKKAPIE